MSLPGQRSLFEPSTRQSDRQLKLFADEPSIGHLSRNQVRTERNNKAIDDYLKSLGHEVERNPQEGVAGAGRQGDRFVDGRKTEYKTLDPGGTAKTIKNQVNNSVRKGGQARDIVIDARGTGLTEPQAREGIKKAMGISRGRVDSIRVIGDGFDLMN